MKIGPFLIKIESRNYYDSKHWSARYKDSQQWEKLIKSWCVKRDIDRVAKTKKKIIFYSQRVRFLDDDNLTGGFKGMRDAIKRVGLIVDDSPKWLETKYLQLKGKDYQTWFEIEEC